MEVKTRDGEKIRLLEFFGGIGAIRKAFERLDIPHEVVDYVEIDEFAVKSYNAMFGTNFEPQDISKWNKDIDVDLIMHGSPCQDFSIAGLQKGGDEGSGTRSSLMYETLRNVKRLRPKYVIWENVKNILSKKHRHNFDKYLDTMEDLGYNNYYQVLNAKDYGIPQNRERVFTVSIRKDIDDGKFKFPEKRELTLRLKDVLETNVDEKYYLSDKQIIKISNWKSYQKPFERVLGNNSISPTLTARGAGEEHAGMITYSDRFDETTNVQVELEKRKITFDGENSIEYKGKTVELPIIAASRGRNLENPKDRRTGQKLQQTIEVNTDGISNCLTTFEKDNYVIERDNRFMNEQYCDYLVENKIVKELDVINHGYTNHRVKALKSGKNIILANNMSPTVTTRPDKLGVTIKDGQKEPINNIGLRIRKLTPKECWRLMNFDDGDFEKAQEVNTDAQLYKQAGNSIVVCVLKEILKNLLKVNENKKATPVKNFAGSETGITKKGTTYAQKN